MTPGRESVYAKLRDLPLRIDGYRLERRSVEVSTGFERVTTTVVLEADDARGQGEDVAYDPEDQDDYPDDLPLAGAWTVDQLSRHLDGLALFRRPPVREAARDYRRWAFESAALDLALRQRGASLGEVLGRPYRPVRFVVSTRAEIEGWLAVDPELEFKLDPASDWTAETMARLAATGRVRALDFKGYYTGTIVETPPDPELYRAVAEAFPEAILEDPAWTEATAEALAGHAERIAWDAPIHAAGDLDAMPVVGRYVNVKPSRFGTARRLFDALDAFAARGLVVYGGGQFELGPGRSQIQALASLFFADAPNDVAPGDYNAGAPRPGLPTSPLAPAGEPRGLGFPVG